MRNYWEESWERKEQRKMERQVMLIRLALVLVIIAIGIVTLIRLDTVLMQQTETLNQLMELRQEVDVVEVEETEVVSLGEYRISHYCVENYPHICNDGESLHTASGEPPIPDYTVAAADSIPFGTKLIIDGAEYKVADRGGAITEGQLDIAVSTHAEAISRGIEYREVWEVKDATLQ
jgi:3D (Asp-Asp-Asp) domain-containing protein